MLASAKLSVAGWIAVVSAVTGASLVVVALLVGWDRSFGTQLTMPFLSVAWILYLGALSVLGLILGIVTLAVLAGVASDAVLAFIFFRAADEAKHTAGALCLSG